MAWYGSGWSHRIEGAFSASTGSTDVTVTIGSAISRFWDNVESDGHDIRVTNGGNEALTFQRQTWDYANKSAVIEIDNYSCGTSNAAVHQLLIYVGNSSASDGAGSFTASGPVSGFVENALPRRVLRWPDRPRPGQTVPPLTLGKRSTETLTVDIDCNPILNRALSPVEGRDLYEEIAYTTLDVKTGGASQSGMYDNDKTRFIGRTLRIQLKAGASGTSYVVIVGVAVASPNEPVNATSSPVRVEEFRFILSVNDDDET